MDAMGWKYVGGVCQAGSCPRDITLPGRRTEGPRDNLATGMDDHTWHAEDASSFPAKDNPDDGCHLPGPHLPGGGT